MRWPIGFLLSHIPNIIRDMTTNGGVSINLDDLACVSGEFLQLHRQRAPPFFYTLVPDRMAEDLPERMSEDMPEMM